MLNSILGSELTLVSFLICTAVSLLLGVGTALVSMYLSLIHISEPTRP